MARGSAAARGLGWRGAQLAGPGPATGGAGALLSHLAAHTPEDGKRCKCGQVLEAVCTVSGNVGPCQSSRPLTPWEYREGHVSAPELSGAWPRARPREAGWYRWRVSCPRPAGPAVPVSGPCEPRAGRAWAAAKQQPLRSPRSRSPPAVAASAALPPSGPLASRQPGKEGNRPAGSRGGKAASHRRDFLGQRVREQFKSLKEGKSTIGKVLSLLFLVFTKETHCKQ